MECRCCLVTLKNGTSNFQSLLSKENRTLYESYFELTNIEIPDSYSCICSICVETLSTSVSFARMCKISDNTLRTRTKAADNVKVPKKKEVKSPKRSKRIVNKKVVESVNPNADFDFCDNNSSSDIPISELCKRSKEEVVPSSQVVILTIENDTATAESLSNKEVQQQDLLDTKPENKFLCSICGQR